jgi:ELWxxDGT repeat protein
LSVIKVYHMRKDHYVSINLSRCIFLAVLLSMTSHLSAQVQLVADLKPGGKSGEKRYFHLHKSDGARAFFVADNSELWTSDGTTAGTKALNRFSGIRHLVVVGGAAYFTAQTENAGYELWRSNGTAGGTFMLKDIFPGRGDSNPDNLTVVNGIVYFSANNGVNGRELWRSNGTAAGTSLVKDIYPGNSGSVPDGLAAVGSKLMFKAGTLAAGYELWVSDGTSTGTVMVRDLHPGEISSSPANIVEVNGWAFFIASTPGADHQLWKSNGTATGTTMVKLLRAGANPMIDHMINVSGTLFFNSYDNTYGNELWRSDGTSAGTYMVKDFTPGSGSSFNGWYEELANINGKLFFTFQSEYPHYNIAMSDGTAAGTKQVTFFPANPMVEVRYNPSLSQINGSAYFVGETQDGKSHLYKSDLNGNVSKIEDTIFPARYGGIEVRKIGSLYYFASDDSYWRSDGTSTGTWRLRSMGYPAGSQPMNLTDVGGTLYFHTAGTDELWKTNGTAASTVKIANADTVYATGAGGNLFFVSGQVNSSPDNSLWRSDGTSAGTFQLANFWYPAGNFKWFNNRMYFNGVTEEHGAELWVSDGTVAGTRLLQDLYPGPGGGSPSNFSALGSTLYFAAYSEANGSELWKTNGESGGSFLVKDIALGTVSSYPEGLTSFKGKVYFLAYHPSYGRELWQSGGTGATTSLVKDIRTGDTDSFEPQRDLGGIIATQDWLFISAINAENRASIWKTDGTAAGTTQIATFSQMQYLPRLMGATEHEVFFVIETNNTSMELWKTNGNTVTRLGSFPDQRLANYEYAALKNNTLYLTTQTNWQAAKSLFRSDGTVAGTYRIDFVGQPKRLGASGPHVYLAGNSQKEGEELFIIQEATTATSFEEPVVSYALVEEQDDISSYPNPFGNSLRVRVAGKDEETFTLRVINIAGQDVETTELGCNADHHVGSTWPKGIYILQVQRDNKIITRRVMKSIDR